jgi:quercetin dioxygenase-like cupin family protein
MLYTKHLWFPSCPNYRCSCMSAQLFVTVSFLTCACFLNNAVNVNGFVCKDSKDVKADDFFLAANLDKARDTSVSKVGSNVTLINVMRIPGLNTLGISLARIDYAPLGENPPHTHPRATEILTVLEGTLHVGFMKSNPDNKLFSKVLNKGDVFVFPEGLIHFQFNPCPVKDRRRRPEGGEWEPIKIPHRNLAYVPKSTQNRSLLTRSRPSSYRQAIGLWNWARNCNKDTERC